MSANQPLISVIVCTHNRSSLLETVLQTLVEQTLAPSTFEIIVVDNVSTDNTADVVDHFHQAASNIRYCYETNVGLAHARNRGWQEAKGCYVAYTDDDCKIPPHWLRTACEIIEAGKSEIFGGPYFAFYNEAKPQWFKDEYGSRELGSTARALHNGEYLSGGNFFVLRSLFEQLGGFPVDLGMSGHRVAYGEETALQMQYRKTFPDRALFYDPNLYVYHLVRTEKLTLRWLVQAFFGKGQYIYLTSRSRTSSPPTRKLLAVNAMKTLVGVARDCIYGFLFRDRKQYPYLQNYLYERTSRYLRTLGKLYAQYQEQTANSKSVA